MLPGDPARMMLDKREDSKQLLIIKHKYGFDRSVSEQYFLFFVFMENEKYATWYILLHGATFQDMSFISYLYIHLVF